MIRILKPKDKNNFLYYCLNRDPNQDFYITKDNKRLFFNDMKVANLVFNNIIKRGDKCIIDEENGIIRGMLLVVGYSDKAHRKYIKLLADNTEIIRRLLKGMVWNFSNELFLKIKRNNPILDVVLNKHTRKYRYKFMFCGGRGKEILLKRNVKIFKKQEKK